MIDYILAALFVIALIGAVFFAQAKISGQPARVVLVFAKNAWYVGATYDPERREYFVFLLPTLGILVRPGAAS